MKKLSCFAFPIVAVCALLGCLFFFARVKPASATISPAEPQGIILVTTHEDELNSDGDCSLREAVSAANSNTAKDACPAGEAGSTDTITFQLPGIITVTSQLSVTAGGPLVIDGGDVITTSGGGTTRIWWVDAGSQLTFSHFAMVDGNSDEGGSIYNNMGDVIIDGVTFSGNQGTEGGAIYNFGTMHMNNTNFNQNNAPAVGGSILNDGIMSISSSSFTENTSYFSSGAIDNWGTLTVTDCIFAENISSDGPGGAISGGPLKIVDSTFMDNSATAGGGVAILNGTIIDSTFSGNTASTGGAILAGVYGEGNLTIINTTITGNSATSSGGGIYDEGVTTITNSTISGNSAGVRGGGITISAAGFIKSTLTVAYSTIADNSAPTGGGMYNNGNTSLSATIIANNPGSDCLNNIGTITDAGHNLDSDGTCQLVPANGSLPGTNPLLGPLQDNGGPTFTMALLAGSPAIDAGDDSNCPEFDQRGMYRPIDGNHNGVAACDIGAFEAGGSLLTVTTLEDELNSDGDCSLREAVEAANTNTAVDLCGGGNLLFDMIIFDVAGDIVLTNPLTVTNSGELAIYGANMISLSGAGVSRVMWVNSGAKLRLLNLTIENGYTSANGAGIYNNGDLTLANCSFSGNAGSYGGGIYNAGSMAIYNSTFFGNDALSGSGVSNWGTLVITNSTFSGNTANDWGGGIDNWGDMELFNCTVSGNSGGDGAGGIYASQLGSTTFINTIVANNQGGDCYGTIIDGGHNLDSDGTCNLKTANSSLPDTDPLLGPLQDNGGFTFTQALLPNSPAIDKGDNAVCPAIDQRSYPRPMDGNGDGIPVCDMGAYEDSLGHLLVNTLADVVKSDGHCSLREALEAANTNALVYDCGQGDSLMDKVYFNIKGTVTLDSQLTVLPGGSLTVDGADVITVSAGDSGRVWWVEPTSELTLQHLIVADAQLSDEFGGGLYNNSGTVTIDHCQFLNNYAPWGGAIHNLGDISIKNSIFSGNVSEGSLGGAIANLDTLMVEQSTFSDNLGYVCGAIDNDGVGFVNSSTFSGNTATWGGAGLCNYGEFTLLNSTVSGNTISDGFGGGIYNDNMGTMTMTNSTITANTAPAGGGVSGGSGITMANTIVANNTGGDCSGAVIDSAHNLDSDSSCGLAVINGSLPGTDPLLGPLQMNGGPTQTHALLEGSPAIDSGDNALCPALDQRGFPRPVDGNGDGIADCDIGAYEFTFAKYFYLPIIINRFR